ncbi:hypothetical protein [Tateyamaria omphalii]|uniref:hypothetical protein n=1 Tax=Tateyamaria omphalii TaxID=299262 RepID=UPI0012F80A91|nr:hypothetical protein [Tateyamaria omphalii]
MLDGYSWLNVPQPTLKPFALLTKSKRSGLNLFKSQPVTVVHSDIRALLPSSSGGVPPSTDGGQVLLTDATFKYGFDGKATAGVPLVSGVDGASIKGNLGVQWIYIYKFKTLVTESIVDRISFRRELSESFSKEFGRENYETIKGGRAFVITDLVLCSSFEVRKIRTSEAGIEAHGPSMTQFEVSAGMESSSDLVLNYSETVGTAVAFKVCELVYDPTERIVRIGDDSIQTYRGSSSKSTDAPSGIFEPLVLLDSP